MPQTASAPDGRAAGQPIVNGIFVAIVVLAFAVAGFRDLTGAGSVPGAADPGLMQALTDTVIKSASGAVELAFGLIGVMTLFLGVMKVAEKGGLLRIIARLVQPLMQRLFPDVPPDHAAMGAMIMNISANIMGLGNAATPFGIRAMQALHTLNAHKSTASNAMVLFLAINTSSVTLLPTGVIGLRAAAGSANPAGIVPTTLFATVVSTAVAILIARLLERVWSVEAEDAPSTTGYEIVSPAAGDQDSDPAAVSDGNGGEPPASEEIGRPYPTWASYAVLLAIISFVVLTIAFGPRIAPWIIPTIVTGLLLFGFWRQVPVYETFIDGARDGFQVAVRIIPYLVAILVAIAMFRQSGALDLLVQPISVITAPLGLPAEGLLMALLRTLSGSGAFGYLASVINDPAIGPDSYTGYLVSTIQGSTETTFYVLVVYFGAVGIKRMRHAIAAGLCADIAGVGASVVVCSLLYGA
jgi:spore maturation protein SpmA